MSELTSAERAKILTLKEFRFKTPESAVITKIDLEVIRKFLNGFKPYKPPDKSHQQQLEDYKRWDKLRRLSNRGDHKK